MRVLCIVLVILFKVISCSEEDNRIDLSYTGVQLRHIEAPVGGIETGHIRINGDGSIRAFDIFGRPATDNHKSSMTFFTLYAAQEGNDAVVRIMGKEHLNDSAGGTGEVAPKLEAASRFKEAVFHNSYPVVQVDLLDEEVPLQVHMSSWSPFIPNDILNSNLPVAVFEWELTNQRKKPVSYAIALAMQNPLKTEGQNGRFSMNELTITPQAVSGWKGFTFSNDEDGFLLPDAGAVRVLSSSENALYVPFLSDRQKALEQFWTDFSTDGKLESRGDTVGSFGRLESRSDIVSSSGRLESRDDTVRYSGEEPGMATLYSTGVLGPGESVTIPFLFSWYAPFGHTAEQLSADDSEKEATYKRNMYSIPFSGKSSTSSFEGKPSASCFESIDDITGYVIAGYKNLRDKTMQFSHSMITSTISPETLDTVLSDFAAAVEQRDKDMEVISKPFPDKGANIYGIGGRSGWDIYHSSSGFAYNEGERVMKFSPAIDVLPVRFFWATDSGWGTINVSRARIILECIHGSVVLQQLLLEGRSFFVFREFVPSRNAAITYDKEALIINFTEEQSMTEGSSFTMEFQ